jgi:hypothetical protein
VSIEQIFTGYSLRLGDDRGVLEREIKVIEELLEEQPDSKCELNERFRYIF